ncbi:hypothetical protein K493DRAFT_312774 [Basidiobolus meristosporus CBS 931.73]|uniref:Cyclin N-terminal domain-containing protein n=1 Tax=Basidiobolus meristosporus CBS 931.73 TaxID=1314790 RepID=A0A1Y1YRA6_9FUNG|nr:hypothetical protein K493DRAFT_312774 [Basidiobolus meristosporus CBS 931.73]|eukprot:ORY00562.1 hypothetical protein K493DRAFT_312774 [Basidiobolus meristosporus CBS 931.73]
MSHIDAYRSLGQPAGSRDPSKATAGIRDRSGHVRKALIGALMAASKYHQDHAPTNSDWARYTSLDLREVTRVELAFLHRSHHQLFVSVAEYERWSLDLMKEIYPGRHLNPQHPPPVSMAKSLEKVLRLLRRAQKDSYKSKRTLSRSRGPVHRSKSHFNLNAESTVHNTQA